MQKVPTMNLQDELLPATPTFICDMSTTVFRSFSGALLASDESPNTALASDLNELLAAATTAPPLGSLFAPRDAGVSAARACKSFQPRAAVKRASIWPGHQATEEAVVL
jgi:hypothetical protein